MKATFEKYIEYGVSSEIAVLLEEKNIPISTFKNTSISNLITKYDLESTTVEFVKECVKRKPIDSKIIQELLDKSNFTCCVCKGEKSDAYIIHHIVEYSVTQDNSYNNLALLCPNDHDLAHRKGISLTNKLTESQLRKAKIDWETLVESRNKQRATKGKSALNLIDLSKIRFEKEIIFDEHAKNFNCNIQITSHTKFILRVKQTEENQCFVVYLKILTDENDGKWIGFGTPLEIKNIYPSERIFRIGKPGTKDFETIEYVMERINESGLILKGNPIKIETVRLWGYKNNNKEIEFEYSFIEE